MEKVRAGFLQEIKKGSYTLRKQDQNNSGSLKIIGVSFPSF